MKAESFTKYRSRVRDDIECAYQCGMCDYYTYKNTLRSLSRARNDTDIWVIEQEIESMCNPVESTHLLKELQ